MNCVRLEPATRRAFRARLCSTSTSTEGLRKRFQNLLAKRDQVRVQRSEIYRLSSLEPHLGSNGRRTLGISRSSSSCS